MEDGVKMDVLTYMRHIIIFQGRNNYLYLLIACYIDVDCCMKMPTEMSI